MYWHDPLHDSAWSSLVARHPQGSVFHTLSWLEALRRTYGYRPVVLTSRSSGEELVDGIPFCEVKSWISGSRLVSLPFSDHCQPLLEPAADSRSFTEFLGECGLSGWKYIEIRMVEPAPAEGVSLFQAKSGGGYQQGQPATLDGCPFSVLYRQYNFHRVDLRPDLGSIFNRFHKNCIQRKIHRAEREKLEYCAGRSDAELDKFYSLLLRTRRRHRLPPQPTAWFRNLRDCFGERLTIRVASHHGRPIASILSLVHKTTVVYKYGCSDADLHKLGAMPMLFWKAIQEEKLRGAQELDLGRSDVNNPGLSTFKEHLGGVRSELVYCRMGCHPEAIIPARPLTAMHAVFARMPGPLAQVAGRMLYKHIG